jgi:hypothetical protein
MINFECLNWFTFVVPQGKEKEVRKSAHQFVSYSVSTSAVCDVCRKPLANKPTVKCDSKFRLHSILQHFNFNAQFAFNSPFQLIASIFIPFLATHFTDCLIIVHDSSCRDHILDCNKFRLAKKPNQLTLQVPGNVPLSALLLQPRSLSNVLSFGSFSFVSIVQHLPAPKVRLQTHRPEVQARAHNMAAVLTHHRNTVRSDLPCKRRRTDLRYFLVPVEKQWLHRSSRPTLPEVCPKIVWFLVRPSK